MKKLVKFISWLFAAGSIVLIAGVFYIYAVMVPALPSIDHLEDAQYQVPLRIYSADGKLMSVSFNIAMTVCKNTPAGHPAPHPSSRHGAKSR